jgi:hypothetical protein
LAFIYSSLIPLAESEMFSNVLLQVPSSTTTTTTGVARSEPIEGELSVVVAFSRLVDVAPVVPPEIMYLTYAIGSQATLGFHATRGCFEVTKFPTCRANGSSMDDTGVADDGESHQDSAANTNNPFLGALFLFTISTFGIAVVL